MTKRDALALLTSALWLDRRINAVDYFFKGLRGLFEGIEEKLDRYEWYDGLSARDDSEFPLGLVFLSAQNFIDNTKNDVRKVLVQVPGLFVTKIDVDKFIDASFKDASDDNIFILRSVANYFKHHTSWGKWESLSWIKGDNPKKRVRSTILKINGVGIYEETEHPLYTAYSTLFRPEDVGKFKELKSALVAWRHEFTQKAVDKIKKLDSDNCNE